MKKLIIPIFIITLLFHGCSTDKTRSNSIQEPALSFSTSESTHKASDSGNISSAESNSNNSINSSSKREAVHVDGYYRKDGTYVNSYKRTTPDSIRNNNYDYKGNYNPYSGKQGTKSYNPTFKSYK